MAKKHANKKKSKNLKQILFSVKFLTVVLASAVVLGIALFTIPVSYVKSETMPLTYVTEYKDESAIELGIEKVAQDGKEGERFLKYQYKQSLFDYLFRKDKVTKLEIENKTIAEPVEKIVLNGTRKWQYMMCSNGTYRYYTNEQFKDRNTGFTSKSPDSCAENNQGNKVSLADTNKGESNTTTPSYVPETCRSVDVPYKTVYKDVDWLYVGETQEGLGFNGFNWVCSDPSRNISSAPIDKVNYRGTKVRQKVSYPTSPTVTAPAQDYAAKRRCDSDYSYAKAKISIAGAGNSSAMVQVNRAYAQCLNSAGF